MGMLDGKVAIITGGTSGIGKRIAEVFVAEGARIVVGARRADEGQQLQRELGESARFIRTDVSDAGQVNAMIDCAVDNFGRIDCLVNNAGSPSPMVSIVDLDIDDFDRVMAINVRGVMLGMKLVIPHMIRQGSGSIINISSGAAIRVSYTAHTYATSKAAVSHLTRSVAAEVGRHGIRVNSISPGVIVSLARMPGLRDLRQTRSWMSSKRPSWHCSQSPDPAYRTTSPMLRRSWRATEPRSSMAMNFWWMVA
jgi:NAD(P)-dependent dehydrogenase (short-subunit alcohol dehydrogenase family)